jgi:predicted Zn-dependent protease with MMP-like domain
MTLAKFERLAAKALKGLPKFFRDRMRNVAVVVAAAPSRAQVRELGEGLLGLYEGVPLLERNTQYSGAMPDKITLFKDNIEDCCSTPEELEEEIRSVVMHEVAHHFGMDDEELREKGLY